MDPTRMPLARELFAQWRRARGNKMKTRGAVSGDLNTESDYSRDFSRRWRKLLEDAGLVTAVEEREAAMDAQMLAEGEWIVLHFVRGKPYLIDRVILPQGAEARWCHAFGFDPPHDAEAEAIARFPWETELAFLKNARVFISFEELQQLNSFLQRGRAAKFVPIKERSLEIFGDEKRLDILYASSALFQENRLSLDQLRCVLVPEPLGWKRGRLNRGPLIVLENASSWDVFCQWDAQEPQFSAIVYGGGLRFVQSVSRLGDIFEELGGSRPILYFGDVDVMGFRIPRRASVKTRELGWGPVQPHGQSYQKLFQMNGEEPITQSTDPVSFENQDIEWLGSLAEQASAILQKSHRIAQEWLGLERLLEMGQTSENCPEPREQKT